MIVYGQEVTVAANSATATTREAAARIGVAPSAVTALAQAGFLPLPTPSGNRLLYPANAVDDLADPKSWPTIETIPHDAIVVRVGPPSTDTGDDRQFIGFTSRKYDPERSSAENEQIRREALRGWWPVANPESCAGLLLVATVAGFVGATYLITKPIDALFGRARFTLTKATPDVSATYLHHRLPLPPGPIALRVARN